MTVEEIKSNYEPVVVDKTDSIVKTWYVLHEAQVLAGGETLKYTLTERPLELLSYITETYLKLPYGATKRIMSSDAFVTSQPVKAVLDEAGYQEYLKVLDLAAQEKQQEMINILEGHGYGV